MFCNKVTTLYWTYEAQEDDLVPGVPIVALYHQWFQSHDDFRNIGFGSFIASQFRAIPTSPCLIPDIVKSHLELCDAAASLLEQAHRTDDTSTLPKNLQDLEHYHLLPLNRATIMVFDKWENLEHLDTSSEDYGFRWSEQHTILVRTGDEAHLSAPIDFNSLRVNTAVLNRDDIPTDEENSSNIGAIRIPISLVVNFIAFLLKREQAAFPAQVNTAVNPDLYPYVSEYGDSSLTVEAWVEAVLGEVEETGIDSLLATRDTIRRVKTEERGEDPSRWELVQEFLGPKYVYG
ncbi:hypothetical protein G7Y89_g11644 [Cudoniella acicularis]|uniref:Uncharacterized protein n=1 Tax=Cudoniella acicularis TaxID=354080 RepID=A0A8H4VXN9_9HELO|nr:hypothetical protein G7Y89_g11644 [Cudoniella acicularis]